MEMAAEAAATASKNNAEMQQFQELQQQIELQRLQQSQQMFLHQQRIQEIQVNKPNSLFINTFFLYSNSHRYLELFNHWIVLFVT
jgi:5-bromo-4-chloroindolyl phosphate hydrolysis protein